MGTVSDFKQKHDAQRKSLSYHNRVMMHNIIANLTTNLFAFAQFFNY